MNAWKRRFLLETIIFRFNVSFRGGGDHDLQFMICSSSWPQRPPSPKPTWHRPHILQSTDALHLYRHRITGPWRKRSLHAKSPWRKSRRFVHFYYYTPWKLRWHWKITIGLIQDSSSNSCCFHCHVSCPGCNVLFGRAWKNSGKISIRDVNFGDGHLGGIPWNTSMFLWAKALKFGKWILLSRGEAAEYVRILQKLRLIGSLTIVFRF